MDLSQELVETESDCQVSTGKCPECDAETHISSDLVIGRQVRCSNCSGALEIVELSPLRLDYAFVAPIEGHQSIRSV